MVKEKNNKKFILINLITTFICIVLFFFTINNLKPSYYIGQIESITKNDDTNIVEVSPMKSTSTFARKIKSKHKLEFNDSISISGLRSRGKEKKDLSAGAWSKMADNLISNFKVGDSIIFEVTSYDKDSYKLDITDLAIDISVQ